MKTLSREVPTGMAKVELNVIPFTPNSKAAPFNYNDKARAAMEEGKSIMLGEKKVKWHKPHELEEVWKDLLKEDSDD